MASVLPRTLQEKLVPAQSVLLVIDMQNDFCAPGGYIDKTMGKDVSAAAPLVPVIDALAASARAAAETSLPIVLSM